MGAVRQSFLEAVGSRLLLADGGMGTQLIDAGLPMGASGDAWCLSQPESVTAIHAAYVEASADIILTNTFQATPIALERHGLSDRAYDLNLRAARLARDAVGSRGFVLGDVGPFGGFLEPLGTATRAEVRGAFAVQVRGLLDGGADAIIIETMTALEELGAAREAVAAVEPGVPVVASVTFDRVADGGFRTMTGVSVADAVSFMERIGIDVLGCNCGTGLDVDDYVQLVTEFRSLSALPLMVQPNAGEPRLERGRIVYDETPERMSAAVPALIDAGASVIGGCCGTTPAHIRLFREKINERGRA